MRSPRYLALRKPAALLQTALLALLSVGIDAAHASDASLEYRVRAAHLVNFTRYIEWPRNSGDLRICVLGTDFFGSTLNDVAADKIVNGRKIVVRRISTPAEGVSCHMVYLSMEGTNEARNTLKLLSSQGVLTVGEDADFLRIGGMIAFAPLDGKICFYINAIAAENAGIHISSRLKVLGRNLHDDGERRR